MLYSATLRLIRVSIIHRYLEGTNFNNSDKMALVCSTNHALDALGMSQFGNGRRRGGLFVILSEYRVFIGCLLYLHQHSCK